MTENNAAQPGLTDDQIEALAKKHIAPHADRLEAIMINPVPYQQTEQFRRVKALIGDLLSKLRAEGVQAGDERAIKPAYGDLLPAIGSDVLIHLAREDTWARHTVVGYYVWGDLQGDPGLQRVFVRVQDSVGYLNARMLRDVRTLEGVPFVADRRAIMASAPVAGEAIHQWRFYGEVAWRDASEDEIKAKKEQPFADDMRFRVLFAAPQASEAVAELPAPVNGEARAWSFAAPGPMADEVRNAALEEAAANCEEHAGMRGTGAWVALTAAADRIRAMKTQADKDGGDCAKGAGDVELLALMERAAREAGGSQWVAEGFESLTAGAAFYGGLIMNADGETIVAQCVNEPNASHMMSSSPANVLWLIRQYRAALSPTPSVVKQSLTATRTGEKGEKDA